MCFLCLTSCMCPAATQSDAWSLYTSTAVTLKVHLLAQSTIQNIFRHMHTQADTHPHTLAVNYSTTRFTPWHKCASYGHCSLRNWIRLPKLEWRANILYSITLLLAYMPCRVCNSSQRRVSSGLQCIIRTASVHQAQIWAHNKEIFWDRKHNDSDLTLEYHFFFFTLQEEKHLMRSLIAMALTMSHSRDMHVKRFSLFCPAVTGELSS